MAAKTFQGNPCRRGHGGLRYINGGGCVACRRTHDLRRGAANREHKRAYNRAYNQANRERNAACNRAYNATNREEIAARKKAYNQANRERNATYKHQRRKNDPSFRLIGNLRRRISAALKNNPKSDRTIALLGCSPKFFLETILPPLLEAAGLTMEGMGSVWHLDHLRPLARFDLSDPEQQKVAFDFSNLRPLRAADNLAKGAKLLTETEIAEHLAHIW